MNEFKKKMGGHRIETTTTVIDKLTGEILYDVTKLGRRSSNGRGWVIVYTDKVTDLLLKCPSYATFKVFTLLAMGQQFEEKGMITTKKAVQEKLEITKKTCLDAFKWLKENFIVNECKIDGYTEFMVNPNYVTVGRNRDKRMQEWIRRWDISGVKIKGQMPRGKKLPVSTILDDEPQEKVSVKEIPVDDSLVRVVSRSE